MNLDMILAALLNFGIGGAMAAAVIWFLYQVTQKTIPEIMRQQREDLKEIRDQSRAALQEQQEATARQAEQTQAFWQRALDAICGRLEQQAVQLSAVDRHTKANEQNLVSLRAYVQGVMAGRGAQPATQIVAVVPQEQDTPMENR